MHVLGLTGSIAMGKSTTANMFREAGVSVHDADRVVHEAYGGDLAPVIEQQFPGSTKDGVVDRAQLAMFLTGPDGPANLKRLEAIVHPVVREAELAFRVQHESAGTPLIVLDIPLLFETGRETQVNSVLVVTAPEDIQRERALARPNMTDDKLTTILSRQLPDAEKRKRADHIIDTSQGLERARDEVHALIDRLSAAK
ncbi:MAG: dephospho-CoA kinase [Pseudomonadota bacterium]